MHTFHLRFKRWQTDIVTGGQLVDRFVEFGAASIKDAQAEADRHWRHLKNTYGSMKFVGLFQLVDWRPAGE